MVHDKGIHAVGADEDASDSVCAREGHTLLSSKRKAFSLMVLMKMPVTVFVRERDRHTVLSSKRKAFSLMVLTKMSVTVCL